MLRIMIAPAQSPAAAPSGKGSAPVDPEELEGSPADNPIEESQEEDEGEDGPLDKLDQVTVVYMGGDRGPFQCDHCEHFQAPQSCSVVHGQIDPSGCCNVFEPLDEGTAEDETGTEPDDTSAPTDGAAPVPTKAPLPLKR